MTPGGRQRLCGTLSVLLVAALLARPAAADLAQALEALERRAPPATLCAAVLGVDPGVAQEARATCRHAGLAAYLAAARTTALREAAEEAVESRRELLVLIRQAFERGVMTRGDLLLAEIALKAAQQRLAAAEAAQARAVQDHRALFGAAPEDLPLPGVPADSLPADEAALLTLLPDDATAVQRRALGRAWIDLTAARHQEALLEPGAAFAGDLARAYHQRFEIGQAGMRSLVAAFDQRDRLAMELVAARHARVAAELELLRLLGRAPAADR